MAGFALPMFQLNILPLFRHKTLLNVLLSVHRGGTEQSQDGLGASLSRINSSGQLMVTSGSATAQRKNHTVPPIPAFKAMESKENKESTGRQSFSTPRQVFLQVRKEATTTQASCPAAWAHITFIKDLSLSQSMS